MGKRRKGLPLLVIFALCHLCLCQAEDSQSPALQDAFFDPKYHDSSPDPPIEATVSSSSGDSNDSNPIESVRSSVIEPSHESHYTIIDNNNQAPAPIKSDQGQSPAVFETGTVQEFHETSGGGGQQHLTDSTQYVDEQAQAPIPIETQSTPKTQTQSGSGPDTIYAPEGWVPATDTAPSPIRSHVQLFSNVRWPEEQPPQQGPGQYYHQPQPQPTYHSGPLSFLSSFLSSRIPLPPLPSPSYHQEQQPPQQYRHYDHSLPHPFSGPPKLIPLIDEQHQSHQKNQHPPSQHYSYDVPPSYFHVSSSPPSGQSEWQYGSGPSQDHQGSYGPADFGGQSDFAYVEDTHHHYPPQDVHYHYSAPPAVGGTSGGHTVSSGPSQSVEYGPPKSSFTPGNPISYYDEPGHSVSNGHSQSVEYGPPKVEYGPPKSTGGYTSNSPGHTVSSVSSRPSSVEYELPKSTFTPGSPISYYDKPSRPGSGYHATSSVSPYGTSGYPSVEYKPKAYYSHSNKGSLASHYSSGGSSGRYNFPIEEAVSHYSGESLGNGWTSSTSESSGGLSGGYKDLFNLGKPLNSFYTTAKEYYSYLRGDNQPKGPSSHSHYDGTTSTTSGFSSGYSQPYRQRPGSHYTDPSTVYTRLRDQYKTQPLQSLGRVKVPYGSFKDPNSGAVSDEWKYNLYTSYGLPDDLKYPSSLGYYRTSQGAWTRVPHLKAAKGYKYKYDTVANSLSQQIHSRPEQSDIDGYDMEAPGKHEDTFTNGPRYKDPKCENKRHCDSEEDDHHIASTVDLTRPRQRFRNTYFKKLMRNIGIGKKRRARRPPRRPRRCGKKGKRSRCRKSRKH